MLMRWRQQATDKELCTEAVHYNRWCRRNGNYSAICTEWAKRL